MTLKIKFAAIFFLLATVQDISAQNDPSEFTKEEENKFNPYMVSLHGSVQGLADFKFNSHAQYLKELWYFSRSFYIKRNYRAEGIEMVDAYIDIRRYEQNRKADAESVVLIPGMRDALVLLPANELLFKP